MPEARANVTTPVASTVPAAASRRQSRGVDFIVRSDALEKFGGDLLQVRRYAEELERRGWDVSIRPFHIDMTFRHDVIVHYVNIDRIYDFFIIIAKLRGNSFFVSAIHHDWEAVARMRRRIPSPRVRRIADRLLPETWREYAAFLHRSVVRPDTLSLRARLHAALIGGARLPIARRSIGRALDRAGAVFLLANGEGASIRREFSWRGRNGVLVPNAVSTGLSSSSPSRTAWGSRSTTLVCAGRVEPRKRTLELARIAHMKRIPVLFLGAAEHAPEEYRREFETLAAESPYVVWRRQVSHQEVLAALAASRVLINPSWVEVQSLVDLEAAIMGCWVVATPAGYSGEWLGPVAHIGNSFDLEALIEVAWGLANGTQPPPAISYRQTWAAAVDTLERCYLRAAV